MSRVRDVDEHKEEKRREINDILAKCELMTHAHKRPSSSTVVAQTTGHTPKKRENVGSNIVNANDKCKSCEKFLNDPNLLFYNAHPQNAEEESIALTDPKLELPTGENKYSKIAHPTTNITGFSIYDKEGHLCAIDSGLIEKHVTLYASGYLKPLYCYNPDIDEDSVPVKDVGPITKWFIDPINRGEEYSIRFSTKSWEYNLLKPSDDYKPVMANLYEKMCIRKVVLEYLALYHYLQPSYEDLLKVIEAVTIPELENIKLTEDMLHKHAQYIYLQLKSFETRDGFQPIVTLPCISELKTLTGVKKFDKKASTKATTTPLVRRIFESFLTDQLDRNDEDFIMNRNRCESCQLPDCGKCNACQFRGHGRTEKTCIRNCEHMAIDENEDSEPEDDEGGERTLTPGDFVARYRKIQWKSDIIMNENINSYYDKVEIDGIQYSNGDYVIVETTLPNSLQVVARIVYMWGNRINRSLRYFHGQIFTRASETILGELGDPREVYLAEICCDGVPLSAIMKKACVEKKTPKHSFNSGGNEVEHGYLDDDGQTYFYKNLYHKVNARFEDLPEDPLCPSDCWKHRFCPSCVRNSRRHSTDKPSRGDVLGIKRKSVNTNGENRTNNICDVAELSAVKWRGYEYKKGTGVFLVPGTFEFKSNIDERSSSPEILKLHDFDEKIYPEIYRKSEFNLRGSNIDTGEPFCIGYISSVIFKAIDPQNIYLNVNVLYRPENTVCRFPQYEDLNVLYWSDEIVEVPFTSVTGYCHIFYEKNIPSSKPLLEWLEQDPCRFYFKKAYDKLTGRFVNVSSEAMTVGKGSSATSNAFEDVKVRPLRTLDVFAGCGGLSYGLQQSGIAECKWAIENSKAAAHTFALNNKSCIVFKEDCNVLLRRVLNGATQTKDKLMLPMQGEVELLCGGPPYQGFSGMVATYLSYCDYYRPKFFILENVGNFVAFKKGMVLKLTLRALLEMGYQCTFGTLQAGNYGVPQARRRLIILAAAPGYKLPFYPEPTNVFSKRATKLATKICGKKYMTNIRFIESAPRRTCTIRDAMCDLPEIPNGADKIVIDYGSQPRSHFQKLVRSANRSARLKDHICKNMAPLVLARIQHIPTKSGSDWRDLPNISVTLTNGLKCRLLQYRYHDEKNGCSPKGELRGVCACASGEQCGPIDSQEQTLIPWCLPHTGNRNNHWEGLYGRVAWDGYFSTTVTDPEPMGDQGRVLHPEQHRVVSVRECARSQGFHDTYVFAGTIMDKHRQIGNAFPPPLGAALGREIKKALLASGVSSYTFLY